MAEDPLVMPNRIYIGGLPDSITTQDIKDRLGSFASVDSVDFIPSKLVPGCHRGFCFVSLQFNDSASWRRCLSTYNGSMWKGKKFIIEPANPCDFNTNNGRISSRGGHTTATHHGETSISSSDVKIHLSHTSTMPLHLPLEKASKQKKKKYVYHSSLFESFPLVTDKNMSQFKHWRQGRYGRAIRSMRLRFPNGTVHMVDPLLKKNSLTKLFGTQAPKPYNSLLWEINDEHFQVEQLSVQNNANVDLNAASMHSMEAGLSDYEPLQQRDETFETKEKKKSIVDLGSLFDPALSSEGKLFSQLETTVFTSQPIKKESPGEIPISLEMVLEDWIQSMPYSPPHFAFSPLERSQEHGYKFSFHAQENEKGPHEMYMNSYWRSQKSSLLATLKEIRRSLCKAATRKGPWKYNRTK